MDKVKHFLAVLKKQHFWVLCGIVVLFGFVSWWIATSSLAKEYETNKGEIASKAQAVDSVLAINPHPNDKGIARLDGEIQGEMQSVLKAWQTLYDRQKNEVFKWPESFGDYFIEHVEAPENQRRIRLDYRAIYANAIGKEVAKLGEIVDAEWVATTGGGGMNEFGMEGAYSQRSNRNFRGGPGEMMDGTGMPIDMPRYKVIWDTPNQSQIMDWYTWSETPTTVAVRVAQEDLWVYQALAKIISDANSTSAGAHDAVVPEIRQINVGYDAATFGQSSGGGGMGMSMGATTAANRIRMPAATATGMSDGMSDGMEDPSGMGMGGEGEVSTGPPPRPVGSQSNSGMFAGDMGGMSETGGMTEPLTPEQKYMSWRYVDDAGKPLTHEELEASTMMGYRLLPFRMSLMVDQRQYARLLLEFRNSVLPVVVREVRINPSQSSGGMGDAMGGMGGGSSRPRASTMNMAGMGGLEGGNAVIIEDHVQPVEITGYVYLIQPPDVAKLSATAAGEEAPPSEEETEELEPEEVEALEPQADAEAETDADAPATPVTPDATAPATTSPAPAAPETAPQASGAVPPDPATTPAPEAGTEAVAP